MLDYFGIGYNKGEPVKVRPFHSSVGGILISLTVPNYTARSIAISIVIEIIMVIVIAVIAQSSK